MAVSPAPRTDHAAFEQLYRVHARTVYAFARSRLGNEAEAEDVTQATFLNAYRSYLSGRSPEHPESWLIAIAQNVCRQRHRQMQRRPRTTLLDERSGIVAAPEGAWTAADIQAALEALPEVPRRALVMRELEGRSYAEIARALGLSDSALQALLFRARRQLREQFESALSCREAQRALGLRETGELGLSERRALLAHMRVCRDCAGHDARSTRRKAPLHLLLAFAPVRRVLQLLGLSGGGGAGTSAGAASAIATKTAAVLVAGTIGGGVGYTIAETPGAPSHPGGSKHVLAPVHVGRHASSRASASRAARPLPPPRTSAHGRGVEPFAAASRAPRPEPSLEHLATPTDPVGPVATPPHSDAPEQPTAQPADPSPAPDQPTAQPSDPTTSVPPADPQSGSAPAAVDDPQTEDQSGSQNPGRGVRGGDGAGTPPDHANGRGSSPHDPSSPRRALSTAKADGPASPQAASWAEETAP